MTPDPLPQLAERLRAFAQARDWEQFHTPKNLAMALAGEAGELCAEFQWLTEAQSRDLDPAQRARVEAEAADVLLYLVRLADQLDIDLVAAAHRKIDQNGLRYPVEKARGNARKWSEL